MIKLTNILMEAKYDAFPLNVLVSHAKRFNTFEEFLEFYTKNAATGVYWHFTRDPKFKPTNKVRPNDLGPDFDLPSLQKLGYGNGLMVTTSFDTWVDSIDDTQRQYVALLDLSRYDPLKIKQLNRGFGNEYFLKHISNIKVIGVYPIKDAAKLNRELKRALPHPKKDQNTLKLIYKRSKA